MLINVKGALDPAHYGIILAESLVDKHGDFYDLTLKQALDELTGSEGYVCDYQVEMLTDEETAQIASHQAIYKNFQLKYFTGWTKTKVIFNQNGPFTRDSLLDAVPRNPT